jgi:hypothetical protein
MDSQAVWQHIDLPLSINHPMPVDAAVAGRRPGAGSAGSDAAVEAATRGAPGRHGRRLGPCDGPVTHAPMQYHLLTLMVDNLILLESDPKPSHEPAQSGLRPINGPPWPRPRPPEEDTRWNWNVAEALDPGTLEASWPAVCGADAIEHLKGIKMRRRR